MPRPPALREQRAIADVEAFLSEGRRQPLRAVDAEFSEPFETAGFPEPMRPAPAVPQRQSATPYCAPGQTVRVVQEEVTTRRTITEVNGGRSSNGPSFKAVENYASLITRIGCGLLLMLMAFAAVVGGLMEMASGRPPLVPFVAAALAGGTGLWLLTPDRYHRS